MANAGCASVLKPEFPSGTSGRRTHGESGDGDLGSSRSSHYRKARGMIDYKAHRRQAESTQHAEVLREVALKRVEAGHRRMRAYAMAWGRLCQGSRASRRMNCYRVLKSEGLIQPKRVGHDLRQAAERRRQILKAPEKLNEVLQGDFTDYVTGAGEKYRSGCVTEYLSRFNLYRRYWILRRRGI